MVRKAIVEERKGPLNGTGVLTYRHIANADELQPAGRLLAHIIVPPGASIGVHRHHGETEPYYILKGEADFTDADGTVKRVQAGDCCLIADGESHGIANNGTEDMEMIAMIYNTGTEQGHAEPVTSH